MTKTTQREADERTEACMQIAHRWAQAAYCKALGKPGEDIDSIKDELRAAIDQSTRQAAPEAPAAATDQPSAGQVDRRESFANWAYDTHTANVRTKDNGEFADLTTAKMFGAWIEATRRASLTPTSPQAIAGQWVRCTPDLINAGVSCAHTPRRAGDGTYSHDHWIAHAPQAAEEQLRRMRAAFHVNMLRAFPDKTHAEIEAEIDKACGAAPQAASQHGDATRNAALNEAIRGVVDVRTETDAEQAVLDEVIIRLHIMKGAPQAASPASDK